MKAFARPPAGTPPQRWWATVKPLLTDQAQLDYDGTDPATVPYTAVTGPPTPSPTPLDEGHTALAALVDVPTTAGTYRVALTAHGTGGWRVSRASPPPDTQ